MSWFGFRSFCLFVCFLLCSLFPFVSVWGQWQADFSTPSRPEVKGWRLDTSFFTIRDGRLSLSADGRQGEHVVAHTVTLSENNRWQGRVQLDKPSTVRNHAYVLLAAYDQDRAAGFYRYLALSVGGGRRQRVSVVTVDLDQMERGGFSLRGEKELIVADIRTSDSSTDVSFDIRLSAEGMLKCFVRDNRHSNGSIFSGEKKWQSLQNGSNSLGFFCLNTKTYSEAMHLSALSLSHEWSGDAPSWNSPGETAPVEPRQELEKEIRTPIITEIMAHPEAKYDEYVELYNPNDEAMELDGVYIGVGRNRGHLRFVSLSDLPPIPARAYVVLTQTPELLGEAFPKSDKSRIYPIKLPSLSNTGCSIALRVLGEVVDYIDYSPSLHRKGLSSKRGVALERTTLLEQTFAPSAWTSASKESGYATPTRANSALRSEERTNEDRGGVRSGEMALTQLLSMLERNYGASLSCSIYSLEGMVLYRGAKDESMALLKGFCTMPANALEAIPTVFRGVVLIVFRSDASGKDECYTLKTFFY